MIQLAVYLRNCIDQARTGLANLLRTRRAAMGDRGYSTEAVIITALLAVTALAAFGYITSKVLAKAHSIDLG